MGHLIFVLSFLSLLAAAAGPQVPMCNPSTEDSALFRQQSARAYFASRAANPQCIEKYAMAKSRFLEARNRLTQLVQAKAPSGHIDHQEAQMESLRQPFLEATNECGPCTTNPISDPVQVRPPGSRTQFWYKSDGSCQLSSTDTAELAKGFDKLTYNLTHLHEYPRHPDSGKGFNAIVTMAQYDPRKGSLQPEIDAFSGLGSWLFVAVKGPIGTIFSYYFYDRFQFFNRNGMRQFTMRGEAIAPRGFVPPHLLSYLSASGRKLNALNSMLSPGSSTTWYVNADGYMRYCATAEFGLQSKFMQNFGRSQMLDLLATANEMSH